MVVSREFIRSSRPLEDSWSGTPEIYRRMLKAKYRLNNIDATHFRSQSSSFHIASFVSMLSAVHLSCNVLVSLHPIDKSVYASINNCHPRLQKAPPPPLRSPIGSPKLRHLATSDKWHKIDCDEISNIQ